MNGECISKIKIDGKERFYLYTTEFDPSKYTSSWSRGKSKKHYISRVFPMEDGSIIATIQLASIRKESPGSAETAHENLRRMFEKGYCMGPASPVIQS